MPFAKPLRPQQRWLVRLTGIRPCAAQWAGLVLLWLGSVAATRWLFHLDFLANAIPGFSEMGIVSPVMFLCAGTLLGLSGRTATSPIGPAEIALRTVALAALLMLPMLMLVEHLSGLSLGVDIARAGSRPSAMNPFPGRMSPNACLGFFFSGIGLLLVNHRASRPVRRFGQAMPFVVAAIGVAGCLGYFLRLEVLYSLASANRLTLPVAYGLVILAVGIWFLGEQGAAPRLTFERHARRITQRSVVVVTLAALAAGVGGFAAIEKSYEENQSRTLLLTATTNAASIANALEVGLWFPRTLATRPTVTQTLQRLTLHPDDLAAKGFLTQVGDSFLSAGITSVRFFNAAGAQVVASGESPLGSGSMSLPMSSDYPHAKVLWNNGYFLHVEEVVVAGNETVGRLVTEQRMPLVTQLLVGIREGAPASDGLICGRGAEVALCGPSRFRPLGFSMPLRDAHGTSIFPFVGAAADHSGVTLTRDLRGVSVVAAFAPIAKFGLGLIVKQDADALYAHLRERVQLLALLLVVLVAAATVAIRSLVRPLVSEIVRAEQRTHAILENSNDAFIGIDERGDVTDWNGEAERTFGWTRKEALGKSVAELIIPPEQRAAHAAGLARFRLTGEGPVVNRRIEIEALH
ncbi:MAG: PAS domain S-box protein, partial [Pseudomonadota bacterium]|nr:PAS domain S-box protein [Pseudomonadota bacterium]